MASMTTLAGSALLMLTVASAGPAQAQDLLSQLQLPSGYVSLDVPRDFGGKPLAGALVQLTRGRGFRYLGHLSDCGLPSQVLTPIPGLMGLPVSARRGFKVDAGLGAAFLRLFKIELSADSAKQVEIQFGAGSDEMLVPLAVVGSAKANSAALLQNCGEVLRLANVYWVNSAVKVDQIRVTLLSENGAKLAGSADQLAGTLTGLNGRTDVSLSANSEIVISKPVYIGFRDAPPAELLTGRIQLQSLAPEQPDKPAITFGDTVYAQ